MKKIVLSLFALALAAPAFAGNKAPKVEAPAGLVDSSGKAVTTASGNAVALTATETAPAPVEKKVVANPKVKKGTKPVAKKKAAAPAAH